MNLGKLLILTGCVFVAAGILLALVDRLPYLGKLPGDIQIKRDGFHLYIPITTSIILSLGFSLVLWVFSLITKK